MLKKEFRDTLRILLESSLLLLAIPLMLGFVLLLGLYVPVIELIKAVLVITLFVFSGYSGIAMFQAEQKDKGFEYLLTLPVSKLKIFLSKLIPRVVVLAVLVGLAILFLDIGFKSIIIPLIFLQLGGVFLSLAFNTFFLGFVAVLLLGFFYSLSFMFITNLFYRLKQFSFDPFSIIPPTLLAALLLWIPLGLSFFLVFRGFDLKPYKYTVRPYFFVALPLLLLQALIILLYFEKFSFV